MVDVDQGAVPKMIALLVKFASTASANVQLDLRFLKVVALMLTSATASLVILRLCAPIPLDLSAATVLKAPLVMATLIQVVWQQTNVKLTPIVLAN